MKYRFEQHPKKKGKCPECGSPNDFRYYEDEHGNPLDRKYGKCERVNSCKYNPKPEGEFMPPSLEDLDSANRIYPNSDNFPALESVKKAKEGIFQTWLLSLGITESHIYNWGIRSHQDLTVFFIAGKGQLYNLKFIRYDPDGHRSKSLSPYYLAPPEGYQFGRCLYGEHLFDPERKKYICIVESEKTAAIASWFYKDQPICFAATGGNTGLGDNSKIQLSGLHNRKIILLPDADEAGRSGFMKLFTRLKGFQMQVQWLDLFPERSDGTDLADVLIEEGEVPEIKWADRITPLDVSKFNITTYNHEEWKDANIEGIFEPNPSQKPPYQKAVLSLLDYRDNKRYKCAGVGDIFVAFAPPKTGKSTICEVWRACFLGCNSVYENLGYEITLPQGKKMLHVDTEMSDEDMWDSVNQSYIRAGLDFNKNHNKNLVCYGLKGVSDVSLKLIFILNLLSSGQYGMAILDGIGDLLVDENDLKESKALMVYLQAVGVRYGICLGATLHTNEGGTHQKGRGHVGSYLKMKASYIATLNWVENVVVISTASNGVRKAPKGLATSMCWNKEAGRFQWCPTPDELTPVSKKTDKKSNSSELSAYENLLQKQGINQLHPELNSKEPPF